MLERYSPYHLFKTADPIFKREVRLLNWQHDPDAPFDGLGRLVGIAALIVVGVGMLFSLFRILAESVVTATGLVTLFLLPLSIVVSVGVDLYSIVSATNFIHSRTTPEILDALRLARNNEQSLVTAYQGVLELRTWRAMTLEMILRITFAVLFIPIFVLMVGEDITRLPLVGIPSLIWLLALGLLYSREALWRNRVVVLLSFSVALKVREVISAVLISSGVTLTLRLLQLAILYFTVNTTLTLLDPLINITGELTIRHVANYWGWVLLVVVLATWGVRWLYAHLREALKRHAIAVLQQRA